jgi:hypothetical protein
VEKVIKTIILDLAGLFVIGSSIYDVYVNYKNNEVTKEIKKLNKEHEDILKEKEQFIKKLNIKYNLNTENEE